MSGRNAIIDAHGLMKRFGDVVALDGLDLSVPEGTVLGLLGPNGAGKTTAVSILTTLLEPDGGTAEVDGFDVCRDPGQVRKRIGLSGQYAAVDEHLTGFENLDMIGRLYRLDRRTARARARELLERFELTGASDRPVKTYSGGMRRRLDLAGALVGEVPVLFLDEPTTGLDPRSRADLWDVIRDLVAAGTTLLLTSQYLEEVDQLANDVVVIDHGRAIAQGTPDELKSQVGGERIEAIVAERDDLDVAERALRTIATGEPRVDTHRAALIVPVEGGTAVLRRALDLLHDESIVVRDIGLRRPTLDEAFLTLTGHGCDDETDDEAHPEPIVEHPAAIDERGEEVA